MLRNISIANRLLLLVLVMTLFAAALTTAFLGVVNLARRTAANEIEAAILSDHKELIKAASHSLALALAKVVEPLADEAARVEAIRSIIRPIRYGQDLSGYFFVQEESGESVTTSGAAA